ncbi:MAG: CapA family protein [Candidatus Falkowbacteria bacterium]
MIKDSQKANNFIFIATALAPILFTFLIFYFAWDNGAGADKRAESASIIADNPAAVFARPAKSFAFNLPGSAVRPLKMLFFGDLILDRHVGEKIARTGLAEIFSGFASDFFRGYDLIGANLEGAVTDKGAHYPPAMSYDFAFSPDLIAELKNYDFNFFNIANNHLSDQGERGIEETGKNLDALGFPHSGCADRKIGECSSEILALNGRKIGLAGFSMVYGLLDQDKTENAVRGLASSTDSVIVNIHWGREYEHNFNATQRSMAHKLIDAGADAVIGHHPHVVQGMEIYKDKPIFYSLGNFIFDQYFSADTQEELAVGLEFGDGGLTIDLFPLRSKSSRPELIADNERRLFFEKFIKWSEVDEIIATQIRSGRFLVE